jgi:hypothetical protein
MQSLERRSVRALSLIKLIFTLLGILSILLCSVATGIQEQSQPDWIKTYGTYGGNSLIQTVDGGFAVAGVNASYSFEMYRGYGQYQPLLIKTNLNGETEWAKTYNLSGSASTVVQTQDNGFLLCGGAWVLKTDVNGTPEWNTTLQSGVRYRAIQASNKDYLVAGYYWIPSDYVPILYKLDFDGNQIWNKTFTSSVSTTSASWIQDILEANDGNYIIVGTWNGDFWFAKTDTNGNLLVNKTYHYNDPAQNGPETFNSISKTFDDCYILTAGDGPNSWLFKINSNGSEEWHQFYGDSNYTGLLSAVETVDGGFVATGGQHLQAIVLKTDKLGKEEWSTTYGQEETIDIGNSVIATNNGFVVTGKLNSSEVWLAKFTLQVIVSPSATLFPSITENANGNITTALIIVIIILVVGCLIGIASVKLKKRKKSL